MKIRDHFIGSVIGREGKGTLTVVSKEVDKYVVECSVCSLDQELWCKEDLTFHKDKIKSGSVGCGCSSRPSWKPRQYLLRCERKCESLGFKFLGFHGKYKGKRTKVKVYNTSNQVCWVVGSVEFLLSKGTACPVVTLSSTISKMTKSDKEHINDFRMAGDFHKDTVFTRNLVKWKPNSRGKRDYVYWDVVCPLCKEDEFSEVKSYFTAHISALKNGNIPCRCSSSYRWSEAENKIRANIVAKDMGYNFLGWKGDYEGDKTYLLLKNSDGEVWDSTSLTNLLQGRGHRRERIMSAAKGRRYSVKHYMDKLNLPEGSDIQRFELSNGNISKKVIFSCGKCKNDRYTLKGLCTGKWETDLIRLVEGSMPCRCSYPYYWTHDQRELDISETLLSEGGKFLHWESKLPNRVSSSKFKWACANGTENITVVDNFLQGSRCSCCNVYGFDKTKPAHIYLCKWYGFGEEYWKVGITNRDYLERINEQYKVSKLDYKTTSVYYCSKGEVVAEIENTLLGMYKDLRNACPKDWLPDGYTESMTFTPEVLKSFHEHCNHLTRVI